MRGVDSLEGDAWTPTSTEGSQASFEDLHISLLLALEKLSIVREQCSGHMFLDGSCCSESCTHVMGLWCPVFLRLTRGDGRDGGQRGPLGSTWPSRVLPVATGATCCVYLLSPLNSCFGFYHASLSLSLASLPLTHFLTYILLISFSCVIHGVVWSTQSLARHAIWLLVGSAQVAGQGPWIWCHDFRN